MSGLVSSRVSIRWGNDAPGENTSTLVLTAPSGLFVDVRILREKLDAPNTPDATQGIDWAFAGRARRFEGGGLWEHWIDSRTDTPSPDHGTCETLPNGDTLERGSMPDDQGVIRPYEEVWRDLPVERNIVVVYVCTRKSDLNDLGTVPELKSDLVYGMVIRIGSWCQGLLKLDGKVSMERWQVKDSQWHLVFRTGETELSCRAIIESKMQGNDIDSDLVWKCVEEQT